MKRKNVLGLVITATILLFAACSGGNGAKEPQLKNQEDSLNYVLGLLNGYGLKDSHFSTDSTDKSISLFLSNVDQEFNAKKTDEVFNYGKNIGKMIKQQRKDGLDMDEAYKFNSDLVMQGIINGLKGFEGGMSPQDANMYYQSTKQKRAPKSRIPIEQFEDHDHDADGTEG